MARTTLDAALMLRAMVDPDDEARIGEANSLTHLLPDADAGLDGLRLGVPSSYFFEEIDPEIERIVRGAIDALARLGAELVAVELSSLPQVIESHWGIMILESHASISAATGGDLSRVGEALRERLAAGLEVLNLDPRNTAATLGRLRAMRDDALADYRRATSQVDALVVPALPRSPVPIAQALTDFTWMGRFTRCFNCTHEPVVCLPLRPRLRRHAGGLADRRPQVPRADGRAHRAGLRAQRRRARTRVAARARPAGELVLGGGADGGAVGQQLGHALHHVGGVVARAHDGVGAQRLGVGDHALHRLASGLRQQLGILAHLAALDRSGARP